MLRHKRSATSVLRRLSILLACLMRAGMGADGDPALAADPVDLHFRLEQEIGHDDNPTQAEPRSATRSNSGSPDFYNRSLAMVRLGFHDLPLACKVNADCFEYASEHQYADDRVTGEISLPFHPNSNIELSPFGSLEHEWLDHKDYQDTAKVGVRWTQDWNDDWSSIIEPSSSTVEYAAPNANLSGHERNLFASMTYWVPDHVMIASIAASICLTKFIDNRSAQDYQESHVGLDMDWRLLYRIDLFIGVNGGPMRYNHTSPRNGLQRIDRQTALDIVLTRPLMRWLSATIGLEYDQTHSTNPKLSYNESRYFIGVVFKTP